MAEMQPLPEEQNGKPDPATAFWTWFTENEHRFREVENTNSEEALVFLDDLIGEMRPFHPWLKALAGPYNNDKYELIITADGDIALFCKVEELVQAAPSIPEWIFTAHKPALGFDGISIDMYDKEFSSSSMHFYPVINNNYPDEVNIMLTHDGYKPDEDKQFQAGGMIYLENGLGEINVATKIDHYEVVPAPAPEKEIELIPVGKLSDYLNWREKEFVEKYESVNISSPEEQFHHLEAEDGEGKPLMAIVDAGFSGWNLRPAFPWLLQVDINFTGDANGLPDEKTVLELHAIEDEIISLFPGNGSIWFIGHRTYDHNRNIYFYSNEFRTNAAILHRYIEQQKWEYEVVFFIRKDKYWRTMEQYFDAHPED